MSGVIPAIPLMIIRPFLPESPAWQQKKRAGTLKRPSFARAVPRRSSAGRRSSRRIMMACAYAAAFGAIQQMPRIVPGLAEVRSAGAARAGADDQRRAVVPGVRRPRGPRRCSAFLAARHHRPAQAAAHVPDPGLILLPLVFFLVPTMRPRRSLQWGIFLRRAGDHRAVQFLGQLPAARVSRRTCAAPARASRPTSAAA